MLFSLDSPWFADDYNFCSAYHCYWQANAIRQMAWRIQKGGKLDIGGLMGHFLCRWQQAGMLTCSRKPFQTQTFCASQGEMPLSSGLYLRSSSQEKKIPFPFQGTPLNPKFSRKKADCSRGLQRQPFPSVHGRGSFCFAHLLVSSQMELITCSVLGFMNYLYK